MGFSSITGDETIMHADNASFDGTSRGGKMTANGQLWIGAITAPHVRVSTLTSTAASVSITNGPGTINLEVNAAKVGQTITGDSGGALSPTGGNWNILGQQAGSIAVMDTIGSVSTLSIEDRTWISSLVVDASSTAGLRGTFQTITLALAAASSGQTIYVRPGTYTENITLKAGVDICAMTGDAYANTVNISGTITATYAGRASITGCRLISGNSDGITVSGSGATVLTLKGCVLSQNANSGTHYSVVSTNANCEIYVFDCFGTTSSNGAWFNIGGGLFKAQGCNLANTGGSSINNSFSGAATTSFITNCAIGTDQSVGTGIAQSDGTLYIVNCNISGQVITSSTASIYLDLTRVFTPNSIALTVGGSNSHEAYNCVLISNNASAITVAVGCTLVAANCTINSTTTNAIAGAGTINSGNLTYVGSSSLMVTTTQVPLVDSNDAIKIKTPGAYPYTTIPQDGMILVDTSSARTITPLSSPTTGQKHIIKDSVGSGASNNITVTPSGKNIDGAASYVINSNYGSITIVYNGAEWSVI